MSSYEIILSNRSRLVVDEQPAHLRLIWDRGDLPKQVNCDLSVADLEMVIPLLLKVAVKRFGEEVGHRLKVASLYAIGHHELGARIEVRPERSQPRDNPNAPMTDQDIPPDQGSR